MTTSRLITEIHWEPGQGFDPRADLVLSDEDKIRLDPSDYCVKLKVQSNFRFPTGADLSARSRTYRPEAVRRLLSLQLNVIHVFDEDGIALTSVRLRIYDGTNDRFWNGSTWAVAGAGDWNTEDEVNQHLASFDVSSKQFAVVLNLVTTDDRYTPLVSSVFVLWEGEVDWSQDIVLDSLTQTLQDELEYASDTVFPPLEANSSSIDLDDYTDESDLVVANVEEVYDHDADPNHTTDILDSYDSGTRVVTLTTAIPMGNRPYFRFRIRASVAWDTHQDFSEVRKLPQVILGDAEAETSVLYPFGCSSGVVRKDTVSAVKLPAPYRTTYQIVAEVLTDRSRDQLRLLDALTSLLTNGPSGEVGPFLRSRATDRRYRIWLTDEFRAVTPVASDLADVRVFRAEFRVVDVASNFAPAINTYAVKSFNLGFNTISSEEEQRAILDDAPVQSGTVETTEIT